VAAIMVLMSVISGKLAITMGVPPVLALSASFMIGTLAGMMNGWMITRLRLPPFIVTLGTWNIFFALNLWLSGAQSIRSQDIDASAPLAEILWQLVQDRQCEYHLWVDPDGGRLFRAVVLAEQDSVGAPCLCHWR
jgi:fructose transport system permease protein